MTVQLEGLEKYGLRVEGNTLYVRQGDFSQSFPLDQLTRDSQGQAVSAQVSISDIVNGERASDEAVRRAGALITNLNTARDVIQVWDPSLFVPEDAGFSTAHFDIFTSKVLTAAAHNPHTFVMLDPNGDPQLLKVAGARLAELSQQKPSIAAKLSRIFVTTALAATLVAGGAVRVHANPSDVAVTPVAGDRYIPIQRMSADEFPNHPTELLNITGQMELKDGQPLDPHYVDTYSIAKGGENINIEHSKLKRVVEGSAPVSERKEYGIWPRFKTVLQYIQQAARNLLAVGSSA
jgi:hypothetical protein